MPAARCDVDHSTEYAKGGETTQEGGRLFCGPHNRARNGREPEPPLLVDTGEDDEGGDRDDEESIQQCRVLTMTRLDELRPRERAPATLMPCA